MIKEIGENERHFNQLVHQYSVLASTWLLGVFVAAGFVLTSELEFVIPTEFLIALVTFFGAVGITLLWYLDVMVYDQLLAATFTAGVELENANCWLPKIRNDMLQRLGGTGARPRIVWFYIGGNTVVLLIGVLSLAIWLLTHAEATLGDYAIIIVVLLVTFLWNRAIYLKTINTIDKPDEKSPEGDTQKNSQKNPLRRMWWWLSGQRDDKGDPLNNPKEAYGKLEEDKYKAKLQLVDRYQSFVAELLRLSLLGIAVFGFLYKEMFTDLDPRGALTIGGVTLTITPLLTIGGGALTIGGVAKILAAAGVVAFGGAAVFALI